MLGEEGKGNGEKVRELHQNVCCAVYCILLDYKKRILQRHDPRAPSRILLGVEMRILLFFVTVTMSALDFYIHRFSLFFVALFCCSSTLFSTFLSVCFRLALRMRAQQPPTARRVTFLGMQVKKYKRLLFLACFVFVSISNFYDLA